MTKRKPPEPKKEFLERMQMLLSESEDKGDYEKYLKTIKEPAPKSIRTNKIKISPENLVRKLHGKGWKIRQPWKEHPEIIIVDGDENGERLEPGVLGRTFEHLLGYYYVQELSSCLPVIALKPFSQNEGGERFLDLCAAPGSKTTQAVSEMKNTGGVVANDPSLGRIKILASNLERCGATNTIITKKDGIELGKKLLKKEYSFDKVLIDAPCSGEGTLRSSPRTALMWNIKIIKGIPAIQKKLAEIGFELLKPGGEAVYSTCTHAPEENEAVIDHLLKKYPKSIKIEKINLPLKTRPGIRKWQDKEYDERVKFSHRIYPQDNNTDGFFLAKIKKVEI